MAPTKTKKRGSDASTKQRGGVAVPLKDAPSTPTHRSPIKKRKAGISLQQKKTLIDNLQLESELSVTGKRFCSVSKFTDCA